MTLPALDPHDRHTVELVTSARAEIARLTLELRATIHKADDAERSAATQIASVPSSADVTRAQALLTQRVEARRAELDRELDDARGEAARIVESARQRAEAHVAAAYDELLGASPTTQVTVARPVPTVVPPATDVLPSAPASPRPPLWSRLLYPDVLLPLIAVVAVLIILLAWIG